MNLNKLTVQDIQELADNPTIFDQGQLCYERKSVDQFYLSGKGITAKIQTKQGNYSVEVRTGGGTLTMNCTCAYEGAVCDHRVAVLLYAIYGDPDDPVGNDEDEMEAIAEDSSPTSTPDALEVALRGMGVDELVKMVLQFVEEFPEVRHLLLSQVNLSPDIRQKKSTPNVTAKELKKEIKNFFEWTYQKLIEEEEEDYYDDSYYYDDYYEEEDENEDKLDLDEVFELAETLNLRDQLDVFWSVVTWANHYFVEEEYLIGDEEITQALERFARVVLALEESGTQKQLYINSVVALLDWEMFQSDELDGVIKDTLDILCTTQEDYHYLIKQLEGCYHEDAVDWIADCYRRLGDEKNYLRWRESNLIRPYQYLELASYWQEQGKLEKYRGTLERWVSMYNLDKLDRDDYGSLQDYYTDRNHHQIILSKLSDFYQEKGDSENHYRMLMLRLEENGYSLDLYQQIKEVATGLKRWSLAQPRLLELASTNLDWLAEIYLYEQEWDKAIALSQNSNCGQFTDLNIAKAVKEHRPEGAIAIYEKVVMQYIKGKTRSNYQTAAMYAETLKSIYLDIVKDASLWQRYIDKLRQTYRGYPALQDEFKGL
ncbi:hypothetical protein [Oscillatoria sp. HE19RPO]|uniref:SWIM zinc finger family protein n=1 Tax=Oscillatoria sp. HE19RPO TaxID=2954806 RepID=UPI0020C332D3|nr:hypothetical protein [Oscillatoria sp. HE19RPO]